MPLFIKLPGGRQLYAEWAGWARGARGIHATREGAEWIFWIGRLHLIYTPPLSWRRMAGGRSRDLASPRTGGRPGRAFTR